MKLFLLVLLGLFLSSAYGQDGANEWKKVKLTTKIDDILELVLTDTLEAKTMRPLARESTLKKITREKIMRQAHEVGATVVLVYYELFSYDPVSNFHIIAWAYKPKEN